MGGAVTYRDTSLIRDNPPPKDHRRALGIALMQAPRWGHVLMSEVPLYGTGFGVQGSGFRVQAPGFRVQGLGLQFVPVLRHAGGSTPSGGSRSDG